MGRQSWQQLPCPHLVGVGEVVREERGRVTRYGVSKRIARGVGVMVMEGVRWWQEEFWWG